MINVRITAAALLAITFVACERDEPSASSPSGGESSAKSARTSSELQETGASSEVTESEAETYVESASIRTGEQFDATVIPGLGSPTSSFRQELRLKQWAKDGGAIQVERAPEGESFLVVLFPDTAIGQMNVSYVSSDYELDTTASDAPLRPYAVTVGGGYEVLGPDVFQKDVFMTTKACTAESPFAVAFRVPRGVESASITVKGVSVPLNL